jgi:hypothetical protein
MRRLPTTLILASALTALPLAAAFPLTPQRVPGSRVDAGNAASVVADPVRSAQLDGSPAWSRFRERHGAWKALWNERTGTPHRAFGRGIALPGFVEDAAGVDRSLRAFVAGNAPLLGDGIRLETVDVRKVREVWYARYRQTFGGIPLLFADWEFRASRGRLVAFGADAHRIPEGTPTRPVIPGAVARVAATEGLSFDPAVDAVEGGADLYLVPTEQGESLSYRLVWDVRVLVADPPGNWMVLVDATNGEVVWRHDRVRHSITGAVTGQIHPNLPGDPLTAAPFRNMRVDIGPFQAVTNASGAYSAAPGGSVTLTAQLRGPFCNVNRIDGVADALFSVVAADPSTVDIQWTGANSHDAERDGFHHVNLAHDYVSAIDPAFIGNDYEMPCNVNADGTCNAFWNGTGVSFFRAGNGCPNTATMPDVVYHEYGHGVNDNLYVDLGSPGGMFSGALHEGMADVLSAFIRDDPAIGRDLFGPGTTLRTVDNTMRWPEDAVADPHRTGQIIGGAWWDLRQAVGLAVAEQLSHFAKYGTPDHPTNDGIAMSEYFIETLVADDDDADLSNGTPHGDAILAAFNAHGIGTGFFIDIQHTPLADQPSSANYAVACTVSYAGPFGALDPSSVEVLYSTNGGPFQPRPTSAGPGPDEFVATIPGQMGAVVRYYLVARDVDGGVLTDPPDAPSRTHVFLAGPAITQFLNELETNPGWTIGAPDDSATFGLWQWGLPVGSFLGPTVVAPEKDHTEFGVAGFFTGNAVLDDPPGTNDVDGGRTTLTTTAFDATTGGPFMPVLEYYRWYTNDMGSDPGNDDWIVRISNDGGASWVDVENTKHSSNGWVRVLFPIGAYVAPTTNMRLRFVAADLGNGSLVEAAVDDLKLVDFPGPVSVEPRVPPERLSLSSPTPNPFATLTRVRFTLPREGRVSLRVHDLQGRVVRTLAEGSLPSGLHALDWDGRDEGGRTLSNGLYFVRLAHPDGAVVRTVALLN